MFIIIDSMSQKLTTKEFLGQQESSYTSVEYDPENQSWIAGSKGKIVEFCQENDKNWKASETELFQQENTPPMEKEHLYEGSNISGMPSFGICF